MVGVTRWRTSTIFERGFLMGRYCLCSIRYRYGSRPSHTLCFEKFMRPWRGPSVSDIPFLDVCSRFISSTFIRLRLCSAPMKTDSAGMSFTCIMDWFLVFHPACYNPLAQTAPSPLLNAATANCNILKPSAMNPNIPSPFSLSHQANPAQPPKKIHPAPYKPPSPPGTPIRTSCCAL